MAWHSREISNQPQIGCAGALARGCRSPSIVGARCIDIERIRQDREVTRAGSGIT